MCGIAGAFGFSLGIDIEERISDALACMKRRGPDHAGYNFVEKNESWKGLLAHTRLSIIDLNDYSNQPMYSPDGRWSLIFNGEIFNYIELREKISNNWEFLTNSDTEVLLALWVLYGPKCLPSLKGMFAFAIYDTEEKKLICVRDAFGIKPFYYSLSKSNFYFASEILPVKALMGASVQPNLEAAYQYLVHGNYGSADQTFISEIRQLEPGQLITFCFKSDIKMDIKEWWRPKIEQTFKGTYEEAVEAIRSQFLKDVRMHLRSDVAIGAALSGGVDSSAIVCAMRHIDPLLEINTFSYIPKDELISEEYWVDTINDFVNANAHKVTFGDSDLFSDIPDLILTQGEPFGSTSIYAQYRVYKLAKECGVTVTLDGQGADEMLAGYYGYPGYRTLSLFSTGKPLQAIKFIKSWRKWPGRGYSQVGLDIARAVLPNAIFNTIRKFFGRKSAPNWLDIAYFRKERIEFTETRAELSKNYSKRRLMERLANSINGRSLPSLLRHGDRNSMRFSVESRVPFLTTELCDLAYSLPEEYLISSSGETKHVFRDAMNGIVPQSLLERRDKVGFSTPEEHWFKNNKAMIMKLLADVELVPFLNSTELLERSERILNGEIKFDWQLWRWINYIQWYKIFIHQQNQKVL